MPISEIRDEVSQGLLDFAWRQWAQVGVSATVEGADRCVLTRQRTVRRFVYSEPSSPFSEGPPAFGLLPGKGRP
jgi:hypothetical protein